MISNKEARYLMTVLATSGNPYFEVFPGGGLDRPGESYAIDTVKYFRSKMEEGSELFFLQIADAHFGNSKLEECRRVT